MSRPTRLRPSTCVVTSPSRSLKTHQSGFQCSDSLSRVNFVVVHSYSIPRGGSARQPPPWVVPAAGTAKARPGWRQETWSNRNNGLRSTVEILFPSCPPCVPETGIPQSTICNPLIILYKILSNDHRLPLGQALRASSNNGVVCWLLVLGFTRRDRIGPAPTEQAFFEHPTHLSFKRARTGGGKLRDRNSTRSAYLSEGRFGAIPPPA